MHMTRARERAVLDFPNSFTSVARWTMARLFLTSLLTGPTTTTATAPRSPRAGAGGGPARLAGAGRWGLAAALVCLLLAPLGASAQIVGSTTLNVARRGHTATALADGRILIVGGENATGVVSESEVLDPGTQT